MARPSQMLPASEPAVTTETFQKHYGRGVGYPAAVDHNHQFNVHPTQHSFYPAPYVPSNISHPHPPQHFPPRYHAHAGPSAPVSSYPQPPPVPWQYPPQRNPAPRESNTSLHSTSKNNGNVTPSLVTPNSHDSETMPTVVDGPGPTAASPTNQAYSTKSTQKISKSKNKDNDVKSSIVNIKKERIPVEEPKVAPMKQDFHFYAADHYEEVHQMCQHELNTAFLDGSIAEINKENSLFLLTTLINSRLIKNWEESPASIRDEYMKKEEADRKRFMSEDEVASRHCATLTARKRSPKQSGIEREESFGLMSAVEVSMLASNGNSSASLKRKGSEVDLECEN